MSKFGRLKDVSVKIITGKDKIKVIMVKLKGISFLLPINIYKKRKKKKFMAINKIPKKDQTNIILSLELLVQVIKSKIVQIENKNKGIANDQLNKEFFSFINIYIPIKTDTSKIGK